MMKTKIMHGDLMDRLAEMPEASCHGCFCDPPYELGFMGKSWDSSGVAFQAETWAAVFRVLKPGSSLLAFGGTRTFHRLTCAIEDAGFEIRDCLMWLYGSGFPKSKDVSKAIDKAAVVDCPACQGSGVCTAEPFDAWIAKTHTYGGTREEWKRLREHDGELCEGCEGTGKVAGVDRVVVGSKLGLPGYSMTDGKGGLYGDGFGANGTGEGECSITAPATDAARLWHGWGSALKPAWEPVVLAMKPLDGTFANNALTHGVAGLNVDGCRIGTDDTLSGSGGPCLRFGGQNSRPYQETFEAPGCKQHPSGRWSANLILSHTESCRMVGVKRVKGYVINRFDDGAKPFGGGVGHKYTTEQHADADGLETVEAWECSEDCPVRMLDEQSGESQSPSKCFRRGKRMAPIYGDQPNAEGTIGYQYGDSGTASRFFYTAKAGRDEREQGLRGQIPCVQCGDKDTKHHVTRGQQVHHLRDAGRDGIPSIADIRRMWTAYKRSGHEGASPEWNLADCIRNNHPTIKPLSVATYLAKLILPPAQDQPRRLLVPFAGVASEMIGAIRAGWDEVVGIELEAGSVAIGKVRLKHAKDKIARNHSFSILQT